MRDSFTPILYNIVNSVNLAVVSMSEMQQSMSADIDTSSLEGAREEINAATMAIQEMNAAMEKQESPATPSSNVPAVKPAPVEIPVVWQTDNLDVFTGTGIERFEQEVQSTNIMLEQLSKTQNTIARQSYNIDIISPEASADLTHLAVRIDSVRQKIQQIESNPVNLGVDGANTELEQLRTQLSQAISEQDQLNAAIDNMDMGAANQAYMRLSQTIGSTERYIRDNTDEQGRFNQEVSEGVAQSNELVNTIGRAAAAYLTVQSAGKALNISDELTQTTARLDLMNDGLQSTQGLVNMTYVAAQDARGSFSDMADVVARFGNNAKDAFSSNAEVISFANLIQKQMTIAGASTQEASNAMLQLSQALASGVLRGDELNSIFEQSPNLIQNIAKYIEGNDELVNKMAKGIGIKAEALSGNVMGHIRDIASEGLISADIVKAAVFSASDEINAKFESMPMTWGQVWQSMQNTALMAFSPVLQRLNDIANSEAFNTFTNNAINDLAVLASIVLSIFTLMGQAGGFIADNWSMISPVVLGAAAAWGVYAVAVNGAKMAEMAQAVWSGITTAAKIVATAATWLFTSATLAQAGAQWGLNAALYACPLVWIIMIIIVLVSVFYAAVAAINHFAGTSISATGVIAGSFVWLCALIANIVIGVLNSLIQAVWSVFVEPFLSIIEFVLNATNGGFNNFGDAVANLLGQIISGFLSMGKIVTKIIDAIFGTDWTAGLSSLQDSVLAWGKNDSAITLDRTAPELQRYDMTDAYSSGYKFGQSVDEKVSNFSLSSVFGATDIPSADDYASAIDSSNFGANVSNIAGNTDKIKDSVDITEEELKYLHDIAERDTVNRFTTAKITVKMPVKANINNNMDLDGIVDHLATGVNEAMGKAAEGVHT